MKRNCIYENMHLGWVNKAACRRFIKALKTIFIHAPKAEKVYERN